MRVSIQVKRQGTGYILLDIQVANRPDSRPRTKAIDYGLGFIPAA